MVVKLILDIATVTVRTQMSAAATNHIEGAPLHLARHHTHHQAGAEVGGNTPDRVHKTIAKAVVVAILAETIKGGVDGHVRNLRRAQDQVN